MNFFYLFTDMILLIISSADSNLDEQIKEILRNRSGEDLSTPPPSESVESSSTVPRVDTKTESLNMETKEHELAEDLMKDINSMLSDFSSELDSMFDWASTGILSTTWYKGL